MNAPIPGTIRDSLQGQTLDGFDPSQFSTAGGMLFYSMDSAPNQIDIHSLVSTFQSVHLPTYGQVIPQSCVITEYATVGPPVSIAAPVNNEIIKVANISIDNNSLGDDRDYIVYIADRTTLARVTILEGVAPFGETTIVPLTAPLICDSNTYIDIVLTGSTDVQVQTYKVAQ